MYMYINITKCLIIFIYFGKLNQKPYNVDYNLLENKSRDHSNRFIKVIMKGSRLLHVQKDY